MWENIKNDEKDPSKRDPKRPSTWEKPAPKASDLTPTAQSHPSGQITRPPNEGKPENKTDNRPRRPRGPKEFASGRNEKGERICYTCGNTGHLASFHKKDDKEPFMRGINSFQLFHDGSRWWIVNIYWQHETANQPIPAKYL